MDATKETFSFANDSFPDNSSFTCMRNWYDFDLSSSCELYLSAIVLTDPESRAACDIILIVRFTTY